MQRSIAHNAHAHTPRCTSSESYVGNTPIKNANCAWT